MLKVLDAAGETKVKIFSGNAQDIEKEFTQFMQEKKRKVRSLVQSQSSIDSGVIITITLLYSDYEAEREKTIGFNR